MALTKVNIIGKKWVNVFKMNDGTTKLKEITEDAYAKLAITNPVNPTIKDGVFLGAYGGLKFDTVSGDLEAGMFYQNGNDVRYKKNGSIKTLKNAPNFNGVLP